MKKIRFIVEGADNRSKALGIP